jgi:hypothetical protein
MVERNTAVNTSSQRAYSFLLPFFNCYYLTLDDEKKQLQYPEK